MILRIYRARVVAGRESEFDEAARKLIEATWADQRGLLGVHYGRRQTDDGQEFVVCSVWRDVEALRDAVGDDWVRPIFTRALRHLVAAEDVDHFHELAHVVGIGRIVEVGGERTPAGADEWLVWRPADEPGAGPG